MAEEDAPERFRTMRQSLAAPESALGDMMASAPAQPESPAVAQEGLTTATYEIPSSVDLAAGQTLSMAFIDKEVPAERVSLFQSERNDPHPVAALLLENDTGASLPPGLLTVYDEADGYVGDAQLAGLPAGESRMASFAADRKVEVTTESQPRETVSQITLVDGNLRATRLSRLVTTYSVKGASDAARTLIIEHPRREGWRFTSDALDNSTPTHHRLRVEIPTGGSAEVVATAERSDMEVFALLDADAETLVGWSGAAADPQTSTNLADLAELKRLEAESQREVNEIELDLERSSGNQARIRENLGSVPAGSALEKRYLAMLEEEEDAIGDLTERMNAAEAKLDERRQEVAEFVRSL